MTERCTVAAIITTYNRADLVREALDSILDQTRPLDEIIVVDDGSTDTTAETLHQYEPRVVVLTKQNEGRPAALNYGLRHVRSAYVLLLDDDDIALPAAIEQHLDFLARNPGCDFTYSPHYFFSGEFCRARLDAQPTPRLPVLTPSEFFIWTMEDMHTKLQGMLIPLCCIRSVGWFDQALLRSQDHDMVIRLARRFRAGCVNTPTCAVRVHGGPRGPGFAQHGYRQRARVWRYYQKLIYQKLRRELKLHEYLPGRGDDDSSLPHSQRRRAFIQRAYIMANHGLYGKASKDLGLSKQSHHQADNAVSASERRLFSMTTFVDDIENIPPMRFYYALGHSTHRYRGCLKPCLRGLYWSVAAHKTRPWILIRVNLLAAAFCWGSIAALSTSVLHRCSNSMKAQ